MRTARLIAIAKAVKNQPENLFDMGVWGHTRTPTSESNVCGTAACAIGSYCLQNPRVQLKLKPLSRINEDIFEPRFNRRSGYSAVAKYLNITLEQAEYLFNPGSYGSFARPTKCKVLTRINEFIKSKGKIPDAN